MNQPGHKSWSWQGAVLSPSLTIVAMLLMTAGKPLDSPFLWAGYAVIIASLAVMNVGLFKRMKKTQ
jgi:hypothetical protein